MDEQPRVLIVDDDAAACEVIRAQLSQEPYALIRLSGGQAALARIKEIAPDIILLATGLPGLDGYEVCRRLRADPEVAEIPVVMLAAAADHTARLESLRAGAADCLTRPLDGALLRARVHTSTRLSHYRRHREAQQQFEWLGERLRDGVLILDGDERLCYANQQARRYLNLPAEGLPETPFLTLARQYYRTQPLDAWQLWPASDAATSTQPRYLVRPETATIPLLWLAVMVLPLHQARVGRWVVHLHDVTEEIGAHQEIYEFHAMISHKLRTPLTHVVGGLELLTLLADTVDADKRREYVELARDGARRLQTMLSDIFEYREHIQTLNTPGAFDLAQLPAVLVEVQDRLEIQPIQFAGTEVTGEIVLTREDIALVLLELCENSQKFHPTHTPTITLSLAAIGETAVRLWVCDDGRYLPQEQLSTIWLPYYQSDRYMTGEVPGIGLGLPSVATRVWNVGGACRTYNRADRPGLVVELTLPRPAE